MLFLGLFGGSLEVNSVLVPNFSHEQIVCVITCYYFDCHDTVGGGQFSHSWASGSVVNTAIKRRAAGPNWSWSLQTQQRHPTSSRGDEDDCAKNR